MNERLRVVVIGAGAIGGWVGGRLALDRHRVVLVGRKPLADAVAAQGLCLRSPDDEALIPHIQVVTSIAEAAPHGPFDLAIFSVKTFDTQSAIAEMLASEQYPNWGRPTILSLQNGVQSEEALAEALGAERIVAGTELNPISTPEPGVVVLEKWRGGVGLAPVVLGASVERWLRAFDNVVLPTTVYADYRAMKWSKLLLNLIGNASAAILDMSTVEVFADSRLFELEVDMLRETALVMHALGLRPVSLPGYPVPWLAWGARWAPFFVLKPVMRKLVSGGRGSKPPSLLLELRRGRRRSEVSELNGAVVRAGERVGQPTPVNRALYETLSRLTQEQIQWDSVRRQPEVLLAVAAEMKRKG
jgi:2-dehydropantoate 2-reductase